MVGHVQSGLTVPSPPPRCLQLPGEKFVVQLDDQLDDQQIVQLDDQLSQNPDKRKTGYTNVLYYLVRVQLQLWPVSLFHN